MAAQEFGGRVDHEIGAVLDGPQEVRGRKGIVHNQHDAVSVGDFRGSVDVREIRAGIAHGFDVDSLRLLRNGALDVRDVGGIHKRRGHALPRHGLAQKVEAAAVDAPLGHNVIAGAHEALQGEQHGGRAARHGQGADAAVKGSHALLEHFFRGVGEAGINIAGLFQGEPVGSLPAVAEDVGRCLIYGHGAGAGRRIGLFLSGVDLKRVEMRHDSLLIYKQNTMFLLE